MGTMEYKKIIKKFLKKWELKKKIKFLETQISYYDVLAEMVDNQSKGLIPCPPKHILDRNKEYLRNNKSGYNNYVNVLKKSKLELKSL